MCITYNCDYLKHSTFRFNLIDFQLHTDFPSQFCVFYSKITQGHSKFINQLRGYYTPNLKLVCFVCYLKIINLFWKHDVRILKKIVQGT